METGEAVSVKLAEISDRILRTAADSKKFEDMKKLYCRPVNIKNLQIPTVNPTIWRQLPRETRVVDAQMQKAVGQLGTCLVPVIRGIDYVQSATSVDKGQVMRYLGDALKLMVYTTSIINSARKDKIQKELLPQFRSICGNAQTSATLLFGDNLKEELRVAGEKSVPITTSSLHQQKRPFLSKAGGAYQRPRSAPSTRGRTAEGNSHSGRTGNRCSRKEPRKRHTEIKCKCATLSNCSTKHH